jgi:hypothetical protein
MKKYQISLKQAWIQTLFTLILLFLLSNAFSQRLNADWKQVLSADLEEFLNCQQKPGDKSACNRFVGQSLKSVYGVDDFYAPQLEKYLTAGEISKFLSTSSQWKLIGHGYEQKALALAQETANSKKAAVAVYMNDEGIGHVVLITPGSLQASGSWGLQVPNVVSFLASQPEKSFVDKGLSFAFGKAMMKDVLLYVRNY